MYVINLSLKIAIWRSINTYILKYARILWREVSHSVGIMVWTSVAPLSHIQMSHTDCCKAGLCTVNVAPIRSYWYCATIRLHMELDCKYARLLKASLQPLISLSLSVLTCLFFYTSFFSTGLFIMFLCHYWKLMCINIQIRHWKTVCEVKAVQLFWA